MLKQPSVPLMDLNTWGRICQLRRQDVVAHAHLLLVNTMVLPAEAGTTTDSALVLTTVHVTMTAEAHMIVKDAMMIETGTDIDAMTTVIVTEVDITVIVVLATEIERDDMMTDLHEVTIEIVAVMMIVQDTTAVKVWICSR